MVDFRIIMCLLTHENAVVSDRGSRESSKVSAERLGDLRSPPLPGDPRESKQAYHVLARKVLSLKLVFTTYSVS